MGGSLSPCPSRYRILEHTADIGIAACGATLGEAFENAAFGMFDLMFDAGASAAPGEEVPVEVEADSPGELLVAWLSALLAEGEIRGLAFTRFRVGGISGGRLSGSAAGVPAETAGLRGAPVKAVTYHELAVEPVPGGWEVRVIFDV